MEEEDHPLEEPVTPSSSKKTIKKKKKLIRKIKIGA